VLLIMLYRLFIINSFCNHLIIFSSLICVSSRLCCTRLQILNSGLFLIESRFYFCFNNGLGYFTEQMCTTQNIGRTPGAKHVDLSVEIISEFVFCEVDRRGSRKRVRGGASLASIYINVLLVVSQRICFILP
jgi:hypothetical protein